MKKLLIISALAYSVSCSALDVTPIVQDEPLDIESMTNCGYFYEYATGLYAQALTDAIRNKSIKNAKDLKTKEVFENYQMSMKSYMTLTSYLITRKISLENEIKYEEAAVLLENPDKTVAKAINDKCIDYVKSAQSLNLTTVQKKIEKETNSSYLAEVLWKSVKKP